MGSVFLKCKEKSGPPHILKSVGRTEIEIEEGERGSFLEKCNPRVR